MRKQPSPVIRRTSPKSVADLGAVRLVNLCFHSSAKHELKPQPEWLPGAQGSEGMSIKNSSSVCFLWGFRRSVHDKRTEDPQLHVESESNDESRARNADVIWHDRCCGGKAISLRQTLCRNRYLRPLWRKDEFLWKFPNCLCETKVTLSVMCALPKRRASCKKSEREIEKNPDTCLVMDICFANSWIVGSVLTTLSVPTRVVRLCTKWSTGNVGIGIRGFLAKCRRCRRSTEGEKQGLSLFQIQSRSKRQTSGALDTAQRKQRSIKEPDSGSVGWPVPSL